MRQLLFVVLFLILLNITIVISAPPKCLTTKNVYYDYKHYSIEYKQEVDWWYLHTAAKANGAFYTDSALSSKKKIIQLPLYDARVGEKYTNPFYKTYQQVFDTQFKSIIYNEQIGNVPEGAHSKGFFIWNDEGGIHVIHSNPNTPYGGYGSPSAKTFMKESTSDHSQHAQHHFCRTISKADLSIIPQYVILGDVRVAGINGKYINVKRFSRLSLNDPAIDKSFGNGNDLLSDTLYEELENLQYTSEITQFIKSNFISSDKIFLNIKQWVQVAYQVATKKITSSTTNEWEYFSGIYDQNDELYYIQSTIGSLINNVRKSQFKRTGNQYSIERVDKDKLLTLNGYRTGYNILYEYISQQTGMNSYKWICHTQTKILNANPSKGRNLMAYDRYGIKVVFQYSFDFNHPKGGHSNLKVNSGHDHTKLFYGYKDENPDLSIMCIGDLNWQGKQEVRGGGIFCSKKMAYLANYLHRHVVFFRDTIGTEKRFTDNVIPNGGSLIDFNFSKVKQELKNILTNNQLQSIGDINFEIRVLFPTATATQPTSQYIPLPGSRVIIMNKQLLIPQYDTDKVKFIANSDQYVYNCGYESVKIPLLVEQNTIIKIEPNTTNNIEAGFKFDLEQYSFNVFTSNDVKLYICPNENNQDCDYEDSEYVQLFTHSPSILILLKKGSVNEYDWDIFKVDSIHYSAQFTTAVKDELVKRLKYVQNIALIKSIAPTYSKTIKISKGTTPLSELYFKDADTLCDIKASSDEDAIIIPYYDYCYDVLFYCFKRIDEFKQSGDIINTADGFKKVYKEFEKTNALTNSQECFKYDDSQSGSNTNIVNSKNNNKNNPAPNSMPKRLRQTKQPWWQ